MLMTRVVVSNMAALQENNNFRTMVTNISSEINYLKKGLLV